MTEFSAAWYLSIVSQAAEATYFTFAGRCEYASWKVAPELLWP